MREAPESSRAGKGGFQEYPKVLYSANGEEHVIARDEDHETDLTADGKWVPAAGPAKEAGAASGQTEGVPTENDLLVFIADMYDVKMGKARKHLEEHGREAVLAE